jgi:hypothetical protein
LRRAIGGDPTRTTSRTEPGGSAVRFCAPLELSARRVTDRQTDPLFRALKANGACRLGKDTNCSPEPPGTGIFSENGATFRRVPSLGRDIGAQASRRRARPAPGEYKAGEWYAESSARLPRPS